MNSLQSRLSNAVVLKSKETPEIQQSSMQALVNLVVSYKVLKPTNACKCIKVFYKHSILSSATNAGILGSVVILNQVLFKTWYFITLHSFTNFRNILSVLPNHLPEDGHMSTRNMYCHTHTCICWCPSHTQLLSAQLRSI
jgi:hypothetical protein